MGVLAAAAATGAVLLTGGLSSAFGPEESWLGPRIRQSVETARAGIGMEAHAAPGVRVEVARPPATVPATGPWQVQIGAFRNPRAAEAYVGSIAGEVPEVASFEASRQVHGGVTRVRIAGIPNQASAEALCRRLSQAGRACFVVARRG